VSVAQVEDIEQQASGLSLPLSSGAAAGPSQEEEIARLQGEPAIKPSCRSCSCGVHAAAAVAALEATRYQQQIALAEAQQRAAAAVHDRDRAVEENNALREALGKVLRWPLLLPCGCR
jgi:hypothetical protein